MKPQKSMQEQWQDSYLSGGSDTYLEDLYDSYLENPNSVTLEWQNFFKQVGDFRSENSRREIENYFKNLPKHATTSLPIDRSHESKQEKVIALIFAYRNL